MNRRHRPEGPPDPAALDELMRAFADAPGEPIDIDDLVIIEQEDANHAAIIAHAPGVPRDPGSRTQRHDGSRTVDMVEQPGRHRPEQRCPDRAVSAGADDDEVGVLRLRRERRPRCAADELALE